MANPGAKAKLSRLMARTGLSAAGLALQRLRWAGRFVRIVNYHGTPSALKDNFAAQLDFLASRFQPCSPQQLEDLILRGSWSGPKPGLILTFDDGLRSNFDFAAPMLEQRGFRGWFFLPTAFLDAPPHAQHDFATTHSIIPRQGDAYPDGRMAMSWDEARDLLRRGHSIGAHTRNHTRLTEQLTPDQLHEEIVLGHHELQSRLGQPVDSFCYVGGEEWTYAPAAAAIVRQQNFRFAFMTASRPATKGTSPLHLHRTNLEADWPVDFVKMFIAGVGDLVHRAKRRRINAKTSP